MTTPAGSRVSRPLPVDTRPGPVTVSIESPIAAAADTDTNDKEHHLQSSKLPPPVEDDIEDCCKTWAGCNPTKAKIPVLPKKIWKGQNNEVRKIHKDEQSNIMSVSERYKKQHASSLYLAKVSAKAEEVNKDKPISDRVPLDEIRKMVKDEEDAPDYEGMMKEEENALLEHLLEKRTVKVQGA
ncbi:hypothetical protein ARMGADRAFT_1088310 [Armillaria gallica]|uniref:Uncharacterized protein n=1 Tax=Armillaria gallica TaxID=47427 RepID=A0A2H3D647_ARMGA|nr:hypothetical protein ARMGADRAFT_1088310 [Armillaria gallica]